jgi:small subunit ribosomal protein S3
MGQKVNPKIFRIGVIKTWPSRWYSDQKDYISKLKQDLSVRRYMIKNFKEAGIDRVEIERKSSNAIFISIFTAKPGLIIGRGGAGADELKAKLHKNFLKTFKLKEINLNINEVDRPNLSSQILVQSMILDIERRIPFKKSMKQTINKAERAGALGVKVVVSGRLNGAEIARREMLISGKLPLHTLRADIDYSRGTAHTTYGSIGIKIWVYKGEVFEKKQQEKGEIIKEKIK